MVNVIREPDVKGRFWEGERCEYCGGPIIEKKVDITRKVKKQFVLTEDVPAGICKECGMRYYSANVLKIVAESIRNRSKVSAIFPCRFILFDQVQDSNPFS